MIANVAGVWVVLMTVDVTEPHAIMLPAPVDALSHNAEPTMVDVDAVHAANVNAVELKIVEGAASVAEPQSPEVARRAYPV